MRKQVYIIICTLWILAGCGSSGDAFNLFSIEEDKKLGAQVAGEIESDSSGLVLLDSSKFSGVYQYLYKVRNTILEGGNVKHQQDFAWRIRVIQNDTVLNAFCTPGGYIYVFTGILKFLESEDQLAGVLGHEMGHADYRHSTRQMTKMYGIQVLLDLVAGDRALVKDISKSLIGLTFSRNHEKEADDASVRFLCPTPYNSAGGAGFFEKLLKEKPTQTPVFLSTHPDPGNRIESYYEKKAALGCRNETDFKEAYQKMLTSLP
jgi:predicted Zn-dependent protease